MPRLTTDLLSFLRAHPLVRALRVVHYDETPAGKIELKARCRLLRGYQLQVYAYQLFRDRPLLRWDNAPHYPGIATAPHHFHDEAGNVGTSPLHGDPLLDVPHVLAEIEKWMAAR